MSAKSTRGFTLVELLVTITIIAVLSSIGFVLYTQTQVAARDSKRIQDLDAIAKALEIYKTANGDYPPLGNTTGGSDACVSQHNPLQTALVPNYMQSVPEDPKYFNDSTDANTYCYWYIKNVGTGKYSLYGRLEKATSPKPCVNGSGQGQRYRTPIMQFTYCAVNP